MARKPKLGLPLQTLRNAPDALEGRRLRGGVFEIDPGHIETAGRLDDRLQIEIEGLKASISKNGQRVPILVRPLEDDRYSLIYGRRRLKLAENLASRSAPSSPRWRVTRPFAISFWRTRSGVI